MTNRIVLGQRGSESGIWVSKPGINALTAGADDLLLSTSISAMQIVASGVISGPSSNTDYDFTIPDLGFTPMVLIGGSHVAAYSFPNATTLRVRVLTNPSGAGGNAVTWAVTNQRIQH